MVLKNTGELGVVILVGTVSAQEVTLSGRMVYLKLGHIPADIVAQ